MVLSLTFRLAATTDDHIDHRLHCIEAYQIKLNSTVTSLSTKIDSGFSNILSKLKTLKLQLAALKAHSPFTSLTTTNPPTTADILLRSDSLESLRSDNSSFKSDISGNAIVGYNEDTSDLVADEDIRIKRSDGIATEIPSVVDLIIKVDKSTNLVGACSQTNLISTIMFSTGLIGDQEAEMKRFGGKLIGNIAELHPHNRGAALSLSSALMKTRKTSWSTYVKDRGKPCLGVRCGKRRGRGLAYRHDGDNQWRCGGCEENWSRRVAHHQKKGKLAPSTDDFIEEMCRTVTLEYCSVTTVDSGESAAIMKKKRLCNLKCIWARPI